MIFPGDFTIDTERGFVDLAEPLVDYTDLPNRTLLRPKLFLRCAINIYDDTTRQSQRYRKVYPVDSSVDSKPEYVPRTDVVLQYKQDDSGNWSDNETDVVSELDFYAAQKLRSYVQYPSASATYSGFLMLNCDGAIKQVTMAIDSRGRGTTKVNRNHETTETVITTKEARHRQQIAEAIATQELVKRTEMKKRRRERRGRKRP